MKINKRYIGVILISISIQAYGDSEQNPKKMIANTEENRTEAIKYIFSINGKKYGIENLPALYTKTIGKKRGLFLEKYLNYTLTLDTLKKEQKEHKSQIEKEIKKELDRKKYLGIKVDALDKAIMVQDITLRTIAKEELAKNKKDLDKEIKEFYEKHKKEYIYDDNIELSYIYFKDENRSKEIFTQLKKEKVTIQRFAEFARKYSANKKLKFEGGYFGFLSKDKKQEKFFNTLWKSKKDGFVHEILKRDDYFFLVYIHQKRKAFTSKFEDVKDDIRNSIVGKRAKVNRWINVRYRELMKTTKIDIYDKFEDNRTL